MIGKQIEFLLSPQYGNDGFILSNGVVKFYDATTRKSLDVYSDITCLTSLGNSVTLNEYAVYKCYTKGTVLLRIEIYDSNNEHIRTLDNIPIQEGPESNNNIFLRVDGENQASKLNINDYTFEDDGRSIVGSQPIFYNEEKSLITNDILYNQNTPEPAPDTCPCTSWLPTSWPCGGLTQEYQVTGNLASRYDSEAIVQEYREWQPLPTAKWLIVEFRASGNATASSTPCYWNLNLERRSMQYNGTLEGGPTTFFSESGWNSITTQPPFVTPGWIELSPTPELTGQWVGKFSWSFDSGVPTFKETGLTPAGDYVGELWIPYPEGGEQGGRANATLTEVAP